MSIEKAEDAEAGVTYVTAHGQDAPLLSGRYYQGFYKQPIGGSPAGATVSGVTAYWDGDEFLESEDPLSPEVEMHTYDFLVEQPLPMPPLTPRPPVGVLQRFFNALQGQKQEVDTEMDLLPSLKNAEACHAEGAKAFGAKNYALACVWYTHAAAYAHGTEMHQHYQGAAENSHTLAYVQFIKDGQ